MRRVALVFAICLMTPALCTAAFNPPRIATLVNPDGAGHDTDAKRTYYIDQGLEININKGDILNVYREKRAYPGSPAVRMFIGTMTIQSSRPGVATGHFTPNDAAIGSPVIRYKTAMRSDIVTPAKVVGMDVLFRPATIDLTPEAGALLQSVADFIGGFAPDRIIIEGHMDTGGDTETNQELTETRAEAVRQYLVETFEFITPGMVEARGYGAERPIAPNDTDENRALNRRIEVIIWE